MLETVFLEGGCGGGASARPGSSRSGLR